MYSSVNNRGFFGVKKVIFGESGINAPIVDLAGRYGMTQGAMGIVVDNEADANKLVNFLTSNFFSNILNACMWGNFRIDWRLFTYFKEEFWDVDVDLDEKLAGAPESVVSGGAYMLHNKTRKIRRHRK
jgi:hypothetical protein